MKNSQERAKLDDYEMKENYDFSGGVRGRFYKKPENELTEVKLDADVLLFLKQQANKQHLEYPLFINSLLREYMNNFNR